MFLNSLNTTEKDTFIKLAASMVKADGFIKESEMQILSAYANEMQIPVCSIDEQYDIDKLINEFAKSSTIQTKRIVFLELLALAFVDGNYALEEKDLVQQMADAFELDKAFIDRSINMNDAYMAVYMSLVSLVEKGA